MQPEIFRTSFQVASYQLDAQSRLRLSSAMRFMQETAGKHLESGGMSYEFLREHGYVFLLTRVALKLLRLPSWDEKIEVQTWFKGFKGAHFVREMRFLDEQGKTLIEAQTLWITVEPETHRIIRPSNDFFHMPPVTDQSISIEAVRVPACKGAIPVGNREVRFTDLDYNNHLNNAVYADIICDYFPGGYFGKFIETLQIDFLGEALCGEVIAITAGKDEQGRVVLTGNTATHKCFTASAALRA